MNRIHQATSLLVLLILGTATMQAQWQGLTNPAPTEIGAVLLLTDGSVIGHEEADLNTNLATVNWYKLTPDINGSYVNGTWSQIASLPANYCPLYFGSAVLPDGRVIVEGGEDNLCARENETKLGAIYDSVADTWTPVTPPDGWSEIGDASSVILPDGTFMQAAYINPAAQLDISTMTWTVTGKNKVDSNQEEGWTLLPNGKVLTVDAYVTGGVSAAGTNSEIYDPSTGLWTSAGSTIARLWDSCFVQQYGIVSHEVGPAVLQPNGKVFAMGGNGCGAGHTAIYDPTAQTWTPGPDFPNSLNMDDGPAALEINGKILMMASPGLFNPPSTFLEWDGSQLTSINGPPNSSVDTSYKGHMLMLPTGQILFTDFTKDVEIFTSTGSRYTGWDPKVVLGTKTTFTRGKTVVLHGSNFNGASQNNAYGDDFQDATNYPLVRFTNVNTGHVFYGRTHDHSTMAVGYHGSASTHVDIPETMETGSANLQVVVNGIASKKYRVVIR